MDLNKVIINSSDTETQSFIFSNSCAVQLIGNNLNHVLKSKDFSNRVKIWAIINVAPVYVVDNLRRFLRAKITKDLEPVLFLLSSEQLEEAIDIAADPIQPLNLRSLTFSLSDGCVTIEGKQQTIPKSSVREIRDWLNKALEALEGE